MTPDIGQTRRDSDSLGNAAITVLSYAILAKQRDPLHRHEYHQLAFCERPGARITLGDRDIRLSGTSAVLVPSGIMHALSSDARCSILCIYFRAALLADGVREVALNKLTKELASELSSKPVEPSSLTILKACLYDQVVGNLHVDTIGRLSSRLESVCEYIRSSPDRSHAVTELAANAGLSARSLRRHVKDQLGCTVAELRTRCRVSAAARLLASGHSIQTAIVDSGFGSAATFYAAFRAVLGMTPRQFQSGVGSSGGIAPHVGPDRSLPYSSEPRQIAPV